VFFFSFCLWSHFLQRTPHSSPRIAPDLISGKYHNITTEPVTGGGVALQTSRIGVGFNVRQTKSTGRIVGLGKHRGGAPVKLCSAASEATLVCARKRPGGTAQRGILLEESERRAARDDIGVESRGFQLKKGGKKGELKKVRSSGRLRLTCSTYTRA